MLRRVAIFAIPLTAIFALSPTLAIAQKVKPAKQAPEINLQTLTGDRVKLAELRGRPVVISFWRTSCLPCRTEFPELVKAHHAHAASRLAVLGVNLRDQEIRTKDVQQFVDEFAVPFDIPMDVRGATRRAYGLFGLPTTVFIDSGGFVRHVHTGPISAADLQRNIALIVPPK